MPFFSQRLRREGERTNKEGVDATKTRALSKEKALVMFSGRAHQVSERGWMVCAIDLLFFFWSRLVRHHLPSVAKSVQGEKGGSCTLYKAPAKRTYSAAAVRSSATQNGIARK